MFWKKLEKYHNSQALFRFICDKKLSAHLKRLHFRREVDLQTYERPHRQVAKLPIIERNHTNILLQIIEGLVSFSLNLEAFGP